MGRIETRIWGQALMAIIWIGTRVANTVHQCIDKTSHDLKEFSFL